MPHGGPTCMGYEPPAAWRTNRDRHAHASLHIHGHRRTASECRRQAEPRGIGTSGARDPLAREVKLLGALLGEVIVEQEGEELLDLVERIRLATIALRRSDSADDRRALAAEMDAIDLPRAEVLIRAFGLYFQLANLAEEKQRVRRLRSRARQTTACWMGPSPRRSRRSVGWVRR